MLASAHEPAEQAYQRLLSPLSQPQRDQLIKLLQLLTGGLTDEARAPFVPLEAPAEPPPKARRLRR